VSKTEKRERQKENRERAREERERLIKRDRQMKTFRGLLFFVVIPIAVIIGIYVLVSNNDSSKDKSKNVAAGTTPTNGKCVTVKPAKPPKDTSQTAPAQTIDPAKTYTAAIDTSCGTITVQLDAKTAPIATNNFVSLSQKGFYDGLTFHRVVKDFVIQAGDPKGDGSGGPGYTVVGEVPTDNYPVGSIAAAKTGSDPAGTMGSQFFIVTGANGATLPNDYARFGNVTQGQAVAKKIESFAPAAGDGAPKQDVIINKITITTT